MTFAHNFMNILMSCTLTTVLLTTSAHAAGPLTVSKVNPRYFTDDTGRAIYLTGSHTWLNLQDGDGIAFDYDEYLAFLKRHNHNFFRLWAWESSLWILPDSRKAKLAPLPYRRTGPGQALDGTLKYNLSQFDEEYFVRLRQRVKAARDKGIYVGVTLFQGFSVARKSAKRHATPWLGHPFHRENNMNGVDGDTNGDGEGYETHTLENPQITKIQEAYVRKVIDTLDDLDNVIYEISNESHGGSTAWQEHLISFIRNYESAKPLQHLIWMSFQWDGIEGPGANITLFQSNADIISPTRGNDKEYQLNPPAADGSKIIISDTDHLWGIGGSAGWVWKSFLRGMHPIFMDPYKESPHHLTDEVDPKYNALRQAMGHTQSYAGKIDLLTMKPLVKLSSTGYCLANPGTAYLVYQPDPDQPFRVDMVKGKYRVEWFNPQTGETVTAQGINVSDGWRDFTLPFDGEAVLYLSRD